MFLKVVKSSQNIPYVYVVEGRRDQNGIIKHKYLFSLGRLDDFINTPAFKKLASLALGSSELKTDITTAISEGEVMKYGHMVLKKLWDKFKLDEFFALIKAKRKTQFNIADAVFYIASRHIMESDSKLGMYESRDKYINLESLGINHLYRALDILSDSKDEIEQYLFEQNKNLFNMKVDIVFYDVTTIYFENTNEDMLRKYGFSKDGKLNTVQISLREPYDKKGNRNMKSNIGGY